MRSRSAEDSRASFCAARRVRRTCVAMLSAESVPICSGIALLFLSQQKKILAAHQNTASMTVGQNQLRELPVAALSDSFPHGLAVSIKHGNYLPFCELTVTPGHAGDEQACPVVQQGINCIGVDGNFAAGG